MVWLEACSKDLIPMVVLDQVSVDHNCYIKNVLPVALNYANEVFGDTWIFERDGANSCRDHLT